LHGEPHKKRKTQNLVRSGGPRWEIGCKRSPDGKINKSSGRGGGGGLGRSLLLWVMWEVVVSGTLDNST